MKIEVQKNADLNKLGELIKDISVPMLTQRDSSGRIVSKPMSLLEMDAEGAMWFFTDQRLTNSDEMASAANLSFADHSNATYVSITGYGEIVYDHARIERLWTSFAKPWFLDGPDSPNLVLLKFIPNAAEYWDSPSSKMIRMFAVAASVVSGRIIGLGEHVTLTNLSRPSVEITL